MGTVKRRWGVGAMGWGRWGGGGASRGGGGSYVQKTTTTPPSSPIFMDKFIKAKRKTKEKRKEGGEKRENFGKCNYFFFTF